MLDPVIHQQFRLLLLATLARNKVMSFKELREVCGMTAGNAGSHLEKLEEAGYVKGARLLVGVSFELHYRITELGADRFHAYLTELRSIVGHAEDVRRTRPEQP